MNKRTFWTVLASMLAANITLSTLNYNYVDSEMRKLQERFEDGERGDMSCGKTSRDSDNHTVPATCSGGILEERDRYLSSQNVLGLGGWQADSNGDVSTFEIYFMYWPSWF